MAIFVRAVKITLTFIMTASLWLAPVAYAQLPTIPCPNGVSCPGGTGGTTSGGVGAINQLITTVIGWLLGIAFGITLLFLVIGGFRYIVSGGNVENAEAAKSTIINAIIGLVIIILSYVILNAIVNLVSGVGRSGP